MSCRRQSSGRISESPIAPLRRKEVTAFDRSNSGASARSRKSRRATLALNSNILRNGELRPSISRRSLSHCQKPPAATVAAPAIRKPRRDRRCVSAPVPRSTRPDVLFIGDLVTLWRLDSRNLIPDDHCAEVVPSRANDLRNMHQEKTNIGDREPKVEPPRHLVAPEQRRDDMELRWFVDRQPR